MSPGTKKVLVVVIVIGVIAVTGIGLFANQTFQTRAGWQRICSDAQEKVIEMANDRSTTVDQRRRQIELFIADTLKQLPRFEFQCELLIPEIRENP